MARASANGMTAAHDSEIAGRQATHARDARQAFFVRARQIPVVRQPLEHASSLFRPQVVHANPVVESMQGGTIQAGDRIVGRYEYAIERFGLSKNSTGLADFPLSLSRVMHYCDANCRNDTNNGGWKQPLLRHDALAHRRTFLRWRLHAEPAF